MFVARAPGKLVALGEYAVLDGGPALVLALDRYAEARLDSGADAECAVTTVTATAECRRFAPGSPSGLGLIDLVAAQARPPFVWRATVDSSAFFEGAEKLGLGSSAAVLCAFAGAFAALARAASRDVAEPTLPQLIALHRAFQGGRGSGLDVAASFVGGAVSFRLGPQGEPHVGSVRLPNSVGFAGIFAGRSASTPEFVAHYRAWRRDRPAESSRLVGELASLAAEGCMAAEQNDAAAFTAVFGAYGRLLQKLGEAIGADIVTAEHRQIDEHARRFPKLLQ